MPLDRQFEGVAYKRITLKSSYLVSLIKLLLKNMHLSWQKGSIFLFIICCYNVFYKYYNY